MGTIAMLRNRRSGFHATGNRVSSSGTPSPPKAFSELNVALIVELNSDGERLLRELQSLRCAVRHIWPPPAQLPDNFDVVYCTLLDDLPRKIPWLPGEPAATLILVDRGSEPLNLKLIHNCAAHGLVHFPITPRSTAGSLAVAREHFLYEQRLRGRIDKLDENLRTIRVVERAKSILMRVKNVSEEEAYNHLRKQAMERRATISAVANAIVDSHELLG
jgi:AmiR/NasT family two-component response regulator